MISLTLVQVGHCPTYELDLYFFLFGENLLSESYLEKKRKKKMSDSTFFIWHMEINSRAHLNFKRWAMVCECGNVAMWRYAIMSQNTSGAKTAGGRRSPGEDRSFSTSSSSLFFIPTPLAQTRSVFCTHGWNRKLSFIPEKLYRERNNLTERQGGMISVIWHSSGGITICGNLLLAKSDGQQNLCRIRRTGRS